MQYLIKENSFFARIAARKLKSQKAAIVFGHTIHLCGATKEEFLENQRWLQHELKHIEQFQRYGFVRFIVLYLWESLRRGYRNNKYEIEAREAENTQTTH